MHKIKKNPKLRAVKFMTELEKRFIIKENSETVKRVIRSHEYNSTVNRRKFIERIRKLCLDFEKPMVDKDISFWKSVIFVDESKFNIFGTNGRITVWRKPNEELNPKNLLPAVKYWRWRHNGFGMFFCFLHGKFSFQ